MDTETRKATTALRERPQADVLIIGGGINGVATFRDLALQGVDVALVERSDFLSGASAASSHMIHGGIRYLENGELRLVHEAVTERNDLLTTAAHYVRPLRTTVPIFSTFSGLLSAPLRMVLHRKTASTERGALLIKVGLIIYDSFSRGGGRVPRHTFRGRRRSLRELPDLNADVKYTATYWDASLREPERLGLDLVRDGVALGGSRARAANYTSAVGVDGGKIVLRDEVTGEEFPFAASVVLNAAGPWTDLANEALGDATRYMGGTKGSHIVLDHPELMQATGGREIFFEHSDGRIVLIYPLNGRVLVGTTDLEHDMSEPAVCTEEEVDYFLDLIGHVFPSIPVDRSQIVFRYSGVRPLPGHGDMAAGFVSRDYRIEEATLPGSDGVPVLSLVGGKWTTFRAVAARLADELMSRIGRTRVRSTKGLPIGGAVGFPRTDAERDAWVHHHLSDFGAERGTRLLHRYGTHALAVAASLRQDAQDAPLSSLPRFSSGEFRHIARTESIVHLEDILLRRTNIAFRGEATPEVVEEVADAVADVMGWDAATRGTEIDRALAAVHAADPVAV
ncbi:glycerol-3-phosphate dehydrogenase/oxidase [Microbacterium sp. KSW4-11]|uniref:Glycerol-3-phosphate dehydrogenase/oxidase n=1 Tax=Microbacterium gawkjiense TaxID=3067309 RepID=A0ABU3GDR8_9MICO|nr:glycerol-3-phosphate dehydrogenase/oxidase [Microbacterium sp. KSW4-11]MDT3317948.1 glycerol-3-phosphate dehydrogenase/oxidase [Microbacterium sp. KSW4-11]